MATEAERLAISTALARATAALDALDQLASTTLQDYEARSLAVAFEEIQALHRSLDRRRQAASAEMAKNGGAL